MNTRAILLVEDNQSDIELTKRALMKAQITNELVVAETGEEALDYLFGQGTYEGRDPQQQPALVLLDLKLPGMDGMDVLRRVRENPLTCRQPVVVLTSSSERSDVSRCYDAGANSYIQKPVDFKEFVDTIQLVSAYWLHWNHLPGAKAKG